MVKDKTNAKLYRFKSPTLKKYLITKEGDILNTATGRWLEMDQYAPGIYYLEIDGDTVPYHAQALLEDIDMSMPFELKTTTTDKVKFFIVKNIKTTKAEIFKSEDMIKKLFDDIDLDLLNKYLLKGYTYNYKDTYIIYNGKSSNIPTVSFTVSETDEIIIRNDRNKQIRQITGDDLYKTSNLLQDNSYITVEQDTTQITTNTTNPDLPNESPVYQNGVYLGQVIKDYKTEQDKANEKIFGVLKEELKEVNDNSKREIINTSKEEIRTQIQLEQSEQSRKLREQVFGFIPKDMNGKNI